MDHFSRSDRSEFWLNGSRPERSREKKNVARQVREFCVDGRSIRVKKKKTVFKISELLGTWPDRGELTQPKRQRLFPFRKRLLPFLKTTEMETSQKKKKNELPHSFESFPVYSALLNSSDVGEFYGVEFVTVFKCN